jgi:hypothetical protein
MPMNRVIFKIWLDAKRSHLKHSEAMDVLYTKEYIKGQLDLLDEIQEDFNLEAVTEDVDYHLENNF